jgi:uncharacterized protein (DUF2164 family)
MVVISKEKIEITTLNAVLAIVVFTAGICTVFYTTISGVNDANAKVSERVGRLETIVPEVNRRLENIEGNINTFTSAVLQIKKIMQ